MKIKLEQFLSNRHSWAEVGRSIASSLIKSNHDVVHLFPTDGMDHLPNHLKPYVIGHRDLNKVALVSGRPPDSQYDLQISYTALKNAKQYLQYGNKNRFLIWAFEWNTVNVLPDGWSKQHIYFDKLLAPSSFCQEGFINSKIPTEKVVVIPHGIDSVQFKNNSTTSLPTKKRFRILANIAQLHKRKNIDGLLEVYGKAFTNKDDVCLILKAKFKQPTQPFDISLEQYLRTFNQKFPNHAEVIVYQDFIEDMSSIYRSVDCVFSMTHCEGFYMPGLEALAAGKINIAPRFSGQLDFLNDGNSLLIDGKVEATKINAMYWQNKPSFWYLPDIDDAVSKLRLAYNNTDKLTKQFNCQNKVLQDYSWDKITNDILGWCT